MVFLSAINAYPFGWENVKKEGGIISALPYCIHKAMAKNRTCKIFSTVSLPKIEKRTIILALQCWVCMPMAKNATCRIFCTTILRLDTRHDLLNNIIITCIDSYSIQEWSILDVLRGRPGEDLLLVMTLAASSHSCLSAHKTRPKWQCFSNQEPYFITVSHLFPMVILTLVSAHFTPP